MAGHDRMPVTLTQSQMPSTNNLSPARVLMKPIRIAFNLSLRNRIKVILISYHCCRYPGCKHTVYKHSFSDIVEPRMSLPPKLSVAFILDFFPEGCLGPVSGIVQINSSALSHSVDTGYHLGIWCTVKFI